jgi:hypothetical protein
MWAGIFSRPESVFECKLAANVDTLSIKPFDNPDSLDSGKSCIGVYTPSKFFFNFTYFTWHLFQTQSWPSSNTFNLSIKFWGLATGQWFSPCPLLSSTNKTDCHGIAEILLKVALNTITLTVQCDTVVCRCYQSLKRKFEFLVRIKFLNLFLYRSWW